MTNSNSNDYIQAFLGWHYFRAEEWTWPIGMIKQYSYLTTTNVIFTDSIPFLAILLKLIQKYLPELFNYLGMWSLGCYMLQGFFAALLLRILACSRVVCILGSIFFILSPILFQRTALIMHTALSSHWLILAALYLYVRKGKYSTFLWGGLWILTLYVHFYFVVMIGLIYAAWAGKQLWIKKERTYAESVVQIGTILGISILAMYSLGYFTIGEARGGGLGGFSMNGISPIMPLRITFTEKINEDFFFLALDALNKFKMPSLNLLIAGQFEGFNYLGMGVIVLLGIVAMFSLKNKHRVTLFLKRNWTLVLAALMLTILALSPIITIGNYYVGIPVPSWLISLWSIVRASGRLFWPVNYLLILVGVVGIQRLFKQRVAVIILLIALGVQVWDGHEFYSLGKKKFVKNIIQPSTQWETVLSKYDHVFYMPTKQNYAKMSYIFLKSRPLLNYIKIARHHDFIKLEKDFTKEMTAFYNGQGEKNRLYILEKSEYALKEKSLRNYQNKCIDGLIVCFSKIR